MNAVTGAVGKCDREREDDQRGERVGGGASAGLIGEAKARTAALTHAGVSNVSKYECRLDTENGVKVYEIEFKCGGYEYDYEINAVTGAVVKAEKNLDE